MTDALLVLEDGRAFRGEAYGAVGETVGEAVFSTGMTGYQETLTDPSYHRQVVVMTAPHIGNTGVNIEDPESSRIWVAGYVVRDPARISSSWRATRGLAEELAEQGVVGISGVDTRALTRHLRERGAMRVGISSTDTNAESLLAKVRAAPLMTGAALAEEVSTPQPYVVSAQDEVRFRVVALDLGIKTMTLRRFAERGMQTHVVPAATSFEQILDMAPDGVFYSNGPGDPATADHAVGVLRAVLERGIPYFGICFGHQLFARALGFPTYKLKYGHRGINQPVVDLTTGKVEVTSHNHGFAVGLPGREDRQSAVGIPGREDRQTAVEGRPGESRQTPYGQAQVSHVCLNDDVIEGLRLVGDDGRLKAFSVQYHPEAAAGPHDAGYLFDRFADLMSGARHAGPNSQIVPFLGTGGGDTPGSGPQIVPILGEGGRRAEA